MLLTKHSTINMQNSNKNLYRLLIFLVFISAAASAYLFYTPQNNTEPPFISTDAPAEKRPDDLKPVNLEQNKNTNNLVKKNPAEKLPQQTTSSQPTTTNGSNTETILITFKIEVAEYKIEIKPGSSAYEAMNALKENGKISFSTKVFSGLGHFVEEINGIKNSPNTGFYWTFYINNQEAKVGISNYILQPNDLITWRYENK